MASFPGSFISLIPRPQSSFHRLKYSKQKRDGKFHHGSKDDRKHVKLKAIARNIVCPHITFPVFPRSSLTYIARVLPCEGYGRHDSVSGLDLCAWITTMPHVLNEDFSLELLPSLK